MRSGFVGLAWVILAAGAASAQVFGTPQQAFSASGFFPSTNEMGRGDFNGDGREDLVLASVNSVANQPWPVRVLLNKGDGTFAEAPDGFFEGGRPATVHPRETIVEDFNRDGRDDVFIADHGFDYPPYPGYRSTLLLSRPDGRLQNANANIPDFNAFTHSAAAGDIDGDGDIDIHYNQAAPEPGKDGAFLLNDGAGVFTRTTLSAQISMTPTLSSDLIDVTGDGLIDLVQGSANGAQPGPPPRNGYGFVRQGYGDGTFGPELYNVFPDRPFGFGSNMFDMKPLDFDGDGDLDFFGTGHNLDGSGRYIQALRNDGTGVFSDATAQLIPANFNQQASNQWIIYLNLADVTGDCQPDIVPGDQGEIVYLPRSANAYGEAQTITTVGINPIEVMDMDGDGGTDIIRGSGVDFWRTPSTAPRACNGLASAVAPSGRTVTPGTFASAFFVVANSHNVMAHRCRLIQKVNGVETKFWYRATNPATNAPVGSHLQRFDIPPGGTKTFVFAIAPQAAASNAAVEIKVDCLNMPTPAVTASVNRFSLSGVAGAAADIIPIASTLSGDGVVRIDGANSVQVFAAAATNVRDGEQLTVRARYTGAETISTFVCETGPTGACLSGPASAAQVTMAPNAPRTFTVLVEPRGVALPPDFANRRVVLEFIAADGSSRGQATVAVTTG